MVRTRHLLTILIAVLFFMSFLGGVTAQRTYHLEQEGARIWINKDGSIDLFYNISITLDSGPEINWIELGQPQRDFTIGQARDQYDHTLDTSDTSSGSDYKVRILLHSPLRAGQTIWVTLMTNVGRMIYEDEKNPGNVGMQFNATWWDEAAVLDIRVAVVMPRGVVEDMVKTWVREWNRTSLEDDLLVVYWEEKDLSPGERFAVGVSFPKEYVETYYTRTSGLARFLEQYGLAILGSAIFLIFVVVIVYVARKKSYSSPKVGIEALGIRRGLTAVEASYLLDVTPTKIVTEILYSLLKKRAIWIESTTPSLKLSVMPSFKGEREASETPLRYYEIDFLSAIRKDGALDEKKLAETVMFIRDTVERKLKGYCRRDTVKYYQGVVEKAWGQVEQAGVPELASKAYDEQLLWLFLDPNYERRTKGAFRDKAFEPSPLWLWYWYGYRHYHPDPTYQPNLKTPEQSANPPKIPGAEFADNIATAVEKTSNNIVTNLEKFANAILPMPTAKASTEPARKGASCVCACAACACACACVSCACACAGGGVG